jgi:cell wall-associated NlpC family hydrolase
MSKDHQRLTPARPDLADEKLRGIVSAERYVNGIERIVVWPSAPLRRAPVPDAPLDTEALMGERATVYDEHEGWSWVQLQGDRYVGYMPSEALERLGAPPTNRVTALRTFVYPGPNLKLPPLTHLSLGATISVSGTSGEYAQLANGGFAWTGHLAGLEQHEADFVAVAERLVGTPYLWGGKTSLGLDCSGLVQLSLDMAGIAAPRDTDMQEEALGRQVQLSGTLSGLQRGDLVFWRGHVGIMLDADRLLHANGHHMLVAVEPLAVAEARIRTNTFGPITSVKRLGRLGAQ